MADGKADYYDRVSDAKIKAREEDIARYGLTSATTPVDSPRYPTQRYSVLGGAVFDNFQSSSALIRDLGGGGKSKGYYIGDTLPDGSNIQDITTGRDGHVRVSVILPDGREAVLGSRQSGPTATKPIAASSPAVAKLRASEGVEFPKAQGDATTQYLSNLHDEADEDAPDAYEEAGGSTRAERNQMLRDIMSLKRF